MAIPGPPGREKPVTHRFSLPGDEGTLAALAGAIDGFIRAAGLADPVCHDLMLVLEELVTNTVNHGRPLGGSTRIHIELRRSDGGTHIRMCDRSIAFDPLSCPPPAVAAGLRDRRVGGAGIPIVRHLVRDGWYRRIAGRNVLAVSLRDGDARQDTTLEPGGLGRDR